MPASLVPSTSGLSLTVLTKEHHFVLCAEITTLYLVQMFISLLSVPMAYPEALSSDRGGQFVSLFWKVTLYPS